MSLRIFTAVVLLGLVSQLSVATARADAVDDRFLSTLRSDGISDHISASHAIEAGHFVCVKLDNGVSPTDVATDVLNSSSMPAYDSGFFVGAAIDAYCPRHKSKLPGA